ncbi:hypothetical protein BJG92_03468 [Arthrobacter sp. SO5]|nr:hypothetical protein [Arthrobacter sp. SO5]
MAGGPFGHETVCFQIDEAGAVGEFADEYLVDAGELLTGVVCVCGRLTDIGVGAEVSVECVEEETVIVLAGSDRGFVQRPRIQRDPRVVGDALDAVGDDQVGVKLRISGTGLPMVEGGSDGSPGAEVGDAVAAGPRVDCRFFEPLQGGVDGVVVGLEDLVL